MASAPAAAPTEAPALSREYKEVAASAAAHLVALVVVVQLWWYLALLYLAVCGYGLFSAKFLRDDLGEEVFLITNAGSATGRALAVELARRGARVALWDASPAVREVERTVRVSLPTSATGCVRTYLVEASNRDLVYTVAEDVERDMGAVTCVICLPTGQVDPRGHAAGAISPSRRSGRHLQAEAADIAISAAVRDTLSSLWVTRAFVPSMVERNRGRVVIVATHAAVLCGTESPERTAAQCAALGLGNSMRGDMSRGRRPVRVMTATVPTVPEESFDEFPWPHSPGGRRYASPQRSAAMQITERKCNAELAARVAGRIADAIERRASHVSVPAGVWPTETLALWARLLPAPVADLAAPLLRRLV